MIPIRLNPFIKGQIFYNHLDIIELLEKAVESEPISEDQKKNALQRIKDLKNDPVLSKLIATGITQLAPKAMEWIAGSPGK